MMEDVNAGHVSISILIRRNVHCICNEESHLVAAEEEGELLIGDPSTLLGYVNQAEKNTKTFIHVSEWLTLLLVSPSRCTVMYCDVDIVQLQPPNGEYGFLGCSDH
jgi:hypothetical protein